MHGYKAITLKMSMITLIAEEIKIKILTTQDRKYLTKIVPSVAITLHNNRHVYRRK